MKVVSNSGPLINLAKVGQFTLLRDLFQHITIPPAVFEEVVIRGGGQPGAGETNTAQWITRGMLDQSDVADILAAELDRGEAEAIALALQEKADWLLIDERVGRRFAQHFVHHSGQHLLLLDRIPDVSENPQIALPRFHPPRR